jgi:hypothetical protein
MKTSFARLTASLRQLFPTLALLASGGLLTAATISNPQVVERGPHHRVWQRTVAETQPDGSVAERVSSYTELASGLHYQNERGEWTESKEEIEIFQGAAVARQGPHSVIFAAQLNSPGAIDLLSPDGKRFRSHVLGLAYTDSASGKSVMIAEVKDSIGAVLPPHQVVYQDAFAGDCVADVRYTYTKGAFEQDVLILTAPPPPETYGLPSATTRLEVWTEFVELPEGTMTAVTLKQEADPAARQRMAEPDLIDQRLDFGVMKFEQGHAFPLGDQDPFSDASVPTGKSVEKIDGRVFLLEKADYADIREHLLKLPEHADAGPRRKVIDPARPADALPLLGAADEVSAKNKSNTAGVRADQRARANSRALLARAWPAPKGARGEWQERQYAKLDPGRKALVLDYLTLNGFLTNFCFKGDTTYFVSNNTVYLYGTTVLEGAACVKYVGSASRLQVFGGLDCRTSAYRPAFFVGKDDDTVGEIITGSTGAPGASRYAGAALHLAGANTAYALHNLRFRNAQRALWASISGGSLVLEHTQFGWADYPIYQQLTPALYGRNLLVHDSASAVFMSSSASVTSHLEHVTVHRNGYFKAGTGTIFLTNSLLISVTNGLVYTGANNVTNLDDTGFFQTVGASSHYLASGSTNRNAGTTNINPALLDALKTRTTYPPIVLTNAVTTDTTLAAQAQRDTDTPDLGAHFDPLDYVASQIAVTNATLTLQTGAALGVYGSSSAPGLVLLDGGKVLSTGAPDNLNRVVRYNLVQEQATTNWSASSVGRSISTVSPYGTNLLASQASFRFTEFSMPANGNDHLYAGATNLTFTVQDCQFHGGKFTTVEPSVTLLNSLFNRVSLTLSANKNPFTALMRNCTLAGGNLWASNAVSAAWTFTDNLFDTTNLVQSGSLTHNYNAYLTNSARLTPNGANDVLLTLTNIAYQSGPLGRFYLPTNLTSHSVLFNSGSAAANTLGLYHYTAVTNQTRELTSTVDLGFHSVAVNSTGQPLDTDGDGLPDYFEDANGNGSVDSGETDWQSAFDWGLRVFITRPRPGGNIP